MIGTETPPPVETWTKRSDCNHNYARPVLDTALAGAGVAGMGFGAVIIASPTPSTTDPASHAAGGIGFIAAGAVIGTFFAISAALGYGRVGSCVDAIARWKGEHPEDVLPEEIPEVPVEVLARQYLQCPVGELKSESISFGRNNQGADPFRWGNVEFSGCGRSTWCGERRGQRTRCEAPADLEVAAQQLAIETGCPAESIAQLQHFATRAPQGRREVFGQSTYRVEACGGQYSCTIPLYAPYDNETLVPSAAQGGVVCKPVTQQKPSVPLPTEE